MKKKHSLKLVIVSLAFLCWLIPILLMVAVMGYYVLSKQDDEQLERLAEQMAASSRICQERLDGAIANSRRISYDKTVQQKYEQYQRGELSYAALYSEVQYYLSVEYSRKKEAAYMEGCTAIKIFFKVIMPLTKPSFATVGIFSFIWSYNDLFTQQFFLRNKEQYAITRLLLEISSREGTNYGLMAAVVSLIVVPMLIVYACLQKYIIKGMTAGALKG